MSQNELSCTILGSFRFKAEIDRVCEEFTDLGVRVLAPPIGPVFSTPSHRHVLTPKDFRPLPSERNHSPADVEESFLRYLSRSDFGYVVDINGYVGPVVNFEMGFALANRIPLFLQYPINIALDSDPAWQGVISRLPVASPSLVVSRLHSSFFDPRPSQQLG